MCMHNLYAWANSVPSVLHFSAFIIELDINFIYVATVI